jgi:aldehyde:ferredoxin oxidoreductase
MEKVAPGGYAGKILRVNLTERNISSEALDERMLGDILVGLVLLPTICGKS